MKATGVVRRIDELGRIVIPKQIRNTFKIKNFDELELFIEDDNIVIRKTGGILLIKDKLDDFLTFIKKYNNIDAFILDKNTVIASNIEEIKDTINFDASLYLNNQEYLEVKISDNYILKGYIKSYQLIYDSNLFGNIVFVLKDKITTYNDILNDIVNIILEFIK